MPHVSKNANFFEKGIKNARLATLPARVSATAEEADASRDQRDTGKKYQFLLRKKSKSNL